MANTNTTGDHAARIPGALGSDSAGSGFLSIGLPSGSIASTQAAMRRPRQPLRPSIWFTITPDGKTTMHILKAEMGQHIGTALAQIIAEELEVKWDDVRLDTPLESVENFATYGLAYTVNSGSVTTEFDRLVARRRRRPHRADRSGCESAGREAWRIATRENSRVIDRQVGTLDRLRRNPAEGEDRSQVRLSGRPQAHHR